jgi:hypothetical protein
LIHELEDDAPRGYEGARRLAPYRAQQTSPTDPSGRVYSAAALDMIRRPFVFRGGRRVLVSLQRPAFVALLRAMRDVPSIEVGFGSGVYASWRDFTMQRILYANHLAGGPLAAPPGKTWHHRAAVDLGVRSDAGRAAMLRHGFVDLLPQDPPHFTLGRRG